MGKKYDTVKLTREEADQELSRFSASYPVAYLLDRDGVENTNFCLICGEDCPCMRKVAEKVLDDGGEQTRALSIGDSEHRATARYVEVDGVPHVLLVARPLGAGSLNEDLIYRDALTGVYNRRFYEDRIKHQYLPSGVAIIDLDDFKLFNDTFGHRAGDVALKAASKAMLESIRSTDILVRYGGDEFVLILPGITSDDFANKLRSIDDHLAATVVPEYPQLRLTASMGGVLAAGCTVEAAVEQADKLRYRAKQTKDSVVTDVDPVLPTKKSRPLVLIIDDSKMNREILSEMLGDDYEILEAASGEEGIEELKLHGHDISLVLLDIVMEGMNGFDVLGQMGVHGWLDDVPVIMISGEDSDEVVLRSYELGASDYISRPFDARVVMRRVTNIIHLYAKQRRLSSMLAQQFYERERTGSMLVDIMSGVMGLKNGESTSHVLHIRKLTDLMLERLMAKTDRYPLTGADRNTISMASALHDIGKMGISEDILNKPGRLTKEEFEVMKTHTTLGADMLAALDQYSDSSLVRTARDICRWHHERWDGRGYPDGLKGDEIPISAQVVSIVDVYDALTSDRVYKKAIPHEEAMAMIARGECGEFNPLLLECLVECQDRIKAVVEDDGERTHNDYVGL